ncbi:MAG: histidinol phosphate phosphatase [Anaerolineaceae bacterium]|nr:histidinol phosphate phosphatase [Anaerolineaceae bacterium]
MHDHLQSYLEFAVETAYLAGRLTLGYFQGDLQPEFKADNSPVTVADRKAEELIRDRIDARYPGHAIVGEEFGTTGSEGASHRWFIDPIDGTKAFARGVPLYAVLLGLEIEGQVRAGAAYYPALDEMLAGATGLGAWWNGRRARVSSVQRLDEAYVSCSDVGGFAARGRGRAWERLQAAVYHRVGWSDAYGYLLVATGRIEIMLDPSMNAYDCGPFPPIFQEAGGYFGDWQGNPSIYAGEALATTQALLPQVLALIREAEADSA